MSELAAVFARRRAKESNSSEDQTTNTNVPSSQTTPSPAKSSIAERIARLQQQSSVSKSDSTVSQSSSMKVELKSTSSLSSTHSQSLGQDESTNDASSVSTNATTPPRRTSSKIQELQQRMGGVNINPFRPNAPSGGYRSSGSNSIMTTGDQHYNSAEYAHMAGARQGMMGMAIPMHGMAKSGVAIPGMVRLPGMKSQANEASEDTNQSTYPESSAVDHTTMNRVAGPKRRGRALPGMGGVSVSPSYTPHTETPTIPVQSPSTMPVQSDNSECLNNTESSTDGQKPIESSPSPAYAVHANVEQTSTTIPPSNDTAVQSTTLPQHPAPSVYAPTPFQAPQPVQDTTNTSGNRGGGIFSPTSPFAAAFSDDVDEEAQGLFSPTSPFASAFSVPDPKKVSQPPLNNPVPPPSLNPPTFPPPSAPPSKSVSDDSPSLLFGGSTLSKQAPDSESSESDWSDDDKKKPVGTTSLFGTTTPSSNPSPYTQPTTLPAASYITPPVTQANADMDKASPFVNKPTAPLVHPPTQKYSSLFGASDDDDSSDSDEDGGLFGTGLPTTR